MIPEGTRHGDRLEGPRGKAVQRGFVVSQSKTEQRLNITVRFRAGVGGLHGTLAVLKDLKGRGSCGKRLIQATNCFSSETYSYRICIIKMRPEQKVFRFEREVRRRNDIVMGRSQKSY